MVTGPGGVQGDLPKGSDEGDMRSGGAGQGGQGGADRGQSAGRWARGGRAPGGVREALCPGGAPAPSPTAAPSPLSPFLCPPPGSSAHPLGAEVLAQVHVQRSQETARLHWHQGSLRVEASRSVEEGPPESLSSSSREAAQALQMCVHLDTRSSLGPVRSTAHSSLHSRNPSPGDSFPLHSLGSPFIVQEICKARPGGTCQWSQLLRRLGQKRKVNLGI